MQFISMDHIGLLTLLVVVIDMFWTKILMLTGYTFCVPLKTKSSTEVIQAYVDEVYAKFGGSVKILSENEMNSKSIMYMCSHSTWDLSTRSTSILTIHNQMEELKVLVTFLMHVCLNMYQNLFNGIKQSL